MAATTQAGGGTDRLIAAIKSAYWVALLIIVAMALATHMLLHDMMSEHKRDEMLISLVSTQKTLSQRILFLANTSNELEPARTRPIVDLLRDATDRFETNNDILVARFEEMNSAEVDAIFFRVPHNLDFFSLNLAANSRRLISALETRLGLSGGRGFYQGGDERARLDETIASTTLAGYSALEELLLSKSQATLDRMLTMHRMLFFATLGVIGLVALFIFRPMSELIRRRTGELVEARNSMAFLAAHDSLTGLHNRTFVRDHFETLIKAAKPRNERVAVLQIDLDRFKQINDTLGHAAGDFVLCTIAQRMRSMCRESDICARLGGDEFLVVLPDAGSSRDIDMLVRRMLGQINEPIVYNGSTIHSGASAGIAVYPVDAEDATDLLVHADLALYSAKKQGGGSFVFFSDELREELEHRKQLELDIADAIAADAFNVYFQPQVSLASGAIIGIEALARWKHPQRGMVSPAQFIPVAEAAGKMPAIGRIVMRKAIFEAASWRRAGIEFGRLAINASGAELKEPDFTDFLFRTLDEAGLSTDKLSLEIVESVILDDEKAGIAAKLRAIRAAGVHLELDDFGTGYASLAHISPDDIDRLKIDRRFVQNINRNGDNSKIVRAIADLARGLGIAIIAEGAETQDELTSLQSLGCDQVQGYSIAFPMPCAEARDWLAARTGILETSALRDIA